jgi:hypothetical protein
MRCPPEKIECGATDRSKAGALMRAAIAVLLVPIGLSGGLVVAVHLQIESILHLVPTLVGACTVLTALGAGLIVCALRLLGHGEQRPASAAGKSDPPTERHTR